MVSKEDMKELWELTDEEIYGKLEHEWIQTLREMGSEFENVQEKYSADLERMAYDSVNAEKIAIRETLQTVSKEIESLYGRPLIVQIEDLEAYSLTAHDPTKIDDIRAMYGLDSPIFDDLNGSVEAG